MQFQGILRKMKTELGDPVKYTLWSTDESYELNPFLGKNIDIQFTGNIFCKKCGNKTKTSFQGFCFDHFKNAPEAAECILHPELCRGHLGEGRDPEWEKANHVQPHYVYLAVSGGIKVGVTRKTQVPTRWIDQGAKQAIILAETPNRYLAGVIEVDLKQYLSDKTNWQVMLKDESETMDLIEERKTYAELINPEFAQYIDLKSDPYQIEFPVLDVPQTLETVSFDKTNSLQGSLSGIKGQYLIVDGTRVFNVRRHEGYEVIVNL